MRGPSYKHKCRVELAEGYGIWNGYGWGTLIWQHCATSSCKRGFKVRYFWPDQKPKIVL